MKIRVHSHMIMKNIILLSSSRCKSQHIRLAKSMRTGRGLETWDAPIFECVEVGGLENDEASRRVRRKDRLDWTCRIGRKETRRMKKKKEKEKDEEKEALSAVWI